LTVTDDDGATDATSSVVTVVGPTQTETIQIADLDGEGESDVGKIWIVSVTATVIDNEGDGVPGAVLSGAWRSEGESSCTTGDDGTCTISVASTRRRAVFSVSEITHPTATYDPEANGDPDNDSDGTTITVLRP
jgi:hypothetical protein